MLLQIHIRDLATIEELHLTLPHGCTMITGETGAGKSIFIEAIELGLGARASANLIRPGKDKADICLCFDITKFPHVIARLQELDFANESHECIIRRIIMQDGRSRCYVNGMPATVQLVKELGESLFHLHGQHEQQVLIKSDAQREMLDRYADHWPLVNEVKHLAENWKLIQEKIEDLEHSLQTQQNQREYLQFQLDELINASLQTGEWEALEIEHRRLTHAEELLRHIATAAQQLTSDENENEKCILSELNNIHKIITSISHAEPKTALWINLLESITIQLSELSIELNTYLSQTELDPTKLATIEERVSQLYNLARKHKVDPKSLPDLFITLNNKLQAFEQNHLQLRALQEEKQVVEKHYQTAAISLSKSRLDAASRLENEIIDTIQSLSLPHGQFKIDLIDLDEDKDSLSISLHGKEKITFLIKTNPDQALQPLAKVISGGELSRLSLAGHLALANKTSIPTLVFDEVDTGLSGATAEKIGKLLRHLGESYQVFCITHQPQVAALGAHHLLVEKYFLDNNTHTRLRLLTTQEKTHEIARMLGGEKVTQKTLAHAQEILDSI
jgi:DNA repair protein RecN (Recombination protein N)